MYMSIDCVGFIYIGHECVHASNYPLVHVVIVERELYERQGLELSSCQLFASFMLFLDIFGAITYILFQSLSSEFAYYTLMKPLSLNSKERD